MTTKGTGMLVNIMTTLAGSGIVVTVSVVVPVTPSEVSGFMGMLIKKWFDSV